MQLREFTVEEQPSPFKLYIRMLKQQIKQDAVDIRTQKHEIRERQHVLGSGAASMEQYHLVTLRLNARARLLIYGTLRGKTWDQMENKHTMTPQLKFALQRIYKEGQEWIKQETGQTLPMIDTVQAIINA